MNVTKLGSHYCPFCGKHQNAAGGEGTPEPGDFGVCIGCAGVAVYDESMALRPPYPEERVQMRMDDGVTKAVSMVKRVHGVT